MDAYFKEKKITEAVQSFHLKTITFGELALLNLTQKIVLCLEPDFPNFLNFTFRANL